MYLSSERDIIGYCRTHINRVFVLSLGECERDSANEGPITSLPSPRAHHTNTRMPARGAAAAREDTGLEADPPTPQESHAVGRARRRLEKLECCFELWSILLSDNYDICCVQCSTCFSRLNTTYQSCSHL